MSLCAKPSQRTAWCKTVIQIPSSHNLLSEKDTKAQGQFGGELGDEKHKVNKL